MPIDTHAHYFPPRLIESLEDRAADLGISLVRRPPACQCALAFEYGLEVRPFPARLIEPVADRLKAMDATGIDRQVLSTWADIFAYALPREKSILWHRTLNDAMSRLVAEAPGRFSFLASVPLPHSAESAAELERSVRDLGAVGAVVCANVDEVNLGEVALDELWAATTELDVGVLIHPAHPSQGGRARRYGLAQIAQYTYDTTLSMGSLIFAGVLDRFPGLRPLVCHGGGSTPYLAGRFDIMHARQDRRASGNVALNPPSDYLQRFYYDTILHAPKTLKFLSDTVGVDCIVLGTDYSFPPADNDSLATVRAAGFSSGEIARIAEENPRRLFPRLP
ncbi:MAG: amidohydrolase family protein [Hyphomicrobiaceae bacterium]